MDLIDEQDDFSVAVHDFLYNPFQAFLKLSLIFGTCDERSEVQRVDHSALEVFRNVSIHDFLCDAFRYGCLTHTWFSDQYRIILCPSAEDLQYSSYLLVSSDYRIEFSLRCPFVKIDSEPAEIFKLVFCHKSLVLYNATLAVCSFEQTAKSQIIFQTLFSDKMSEGQNSITLP